MVQEIKGGNYARDKGQHATPTIVDHPSNVTACAYIPKLNPSLCPLLPYDYLAMTTRRHHSD